MSQLKAFKEAKKKVQEAIAERNLVLKGAFAEASRALFDNFPIESVSWHQYTPFFNDGDTCEFSVYNDYPDITLIGGEVIEDCDISEVNERSARKKKLTDEERSLQAAHEFLHLFDEDEYETLFGDHARITLAREDDGSVRVEEEEFEHD